MGAAEGCFHCELPVAQPARWRAALLGAERAFCCPGCQAVATTIAAAGLGGYYETRTAPGTRPPPSRPRNVPHAGGNEAALILEGVRCSACLWLIERTLRALPGVASAEINYATRRARVAWDRQRLGLDDIVEAIRGVGYDAAPYDPRRNEEAQRRERRDALWRLFVAGLGAMQVMMYAFPAYVDEGAGTLSAEAGRMMRWASLLITLPVVLFSCRPFFASAWRELRRRTPGLDTPIALGIAAGFAASAWATWSGGGAVYFDSIAMLAFLLLGARYVELLARQRAARELDSVLRAGEPAPRECAVGDVLQVAPGESIPADGRVLSGASSADESLLTGEARPVPKAPGAGVLAGSVNLEQPLTVRVERAGTRTRAAAIGRLVERAAAGRPRLVERADRIARVLTWVVLATAAAGYAWSGDPWIAVAVLVATCPCALALAAPIVLTRAHAQLLARGVALTHARALQGLDEATDVVLDKTGTLTSGRLRILETRPLGGCTEERALAMARALQASSRHPLAQAFQGSTPLEAGEPRHFAGRGIEATIEGRRARIGTEAFCRELCGRVLPRQPGASVYLADETGWLAAFALEGELRPGAAALVEALRAQGARVHLLSGDLPEAAEALARELGIESWAGGALPEDKLAFVERLQRAGRVVAMLGDGLNDAAVLARADVSLAMGAGADAAKLRSDVALLGDSLEEVPVLMGVAKRTMGIVQQNFAWALAYNAAALPLAALGLIGPWEAALGMAASSAAVVLNALRPLLPSGPWKASTSSSPSRSLSYS